MKPDKTVSTTKQGSHDSKVSTKSPAPEKSSKSDKKANNTTKPEVEKPNGDHKKKNSTTSKKPTPKFVQFRSGFLLP